MQRRKYQEMTVFGISLGMMSCFVSIGTVIFQTAVNRLGSDAVYRHGYDDLCQPESGGRRI